MHDHIDVSSINGSMGAQTHASCMQSQHWMRFILAIAHCRQAKATQGVPDLLLVSLSRTDALGFFGTLCFLALSLAAARVFLWDR